MLSLAKLVHELGPGDEAVQSLLPGLTTTVLVLLREQVFGPTGVYLFDLLLICHTPF